MALSYYKITITEHDYHYTTYTMWVAGTSRNQAIVIAAAMAGQERSRREFERVNGRMNSLVPSAMIEPDILIDKATLEEYWEHRDTVEVKE